MTQSTRTTYAQLAAVLAAFVVIVPVWLYTFVDYIRRSHQREAPTNVRNLYIAAAAYYEGSRAPRRS